jgi:hypothetical protein
LNEKIGISEKAAQRDFFVQHLADNLVFRRANGAVIGKQEFLEGLKPDQLEMLETFVDDITINQESAVVDVTVKAKRRNQSPAEFRNIRMFQKNGTQWQLAAWINTKLRDLEPNG